MEYNIMQCSVPNIPYENNFYTCVKQIYPKSITTDITNGIITHQIILVLIEQ